ncbi:MAG: biotin/lipoyl-containing protein [Planctomycetota bacterium]
MKYHVLIGDVHHEVTVTRDGGGFRVELDGESMHVDVGTLAEGHAYSLLVDDRSVDVGVEERPGDALELMVAGRRYSTEVLGEREWLARSIQPDSEDGDRTVRANMTGIVRQVLVAEGDAVQKGQTLLILEAMKMENEVKAEADGTATRIVVEAGATVSIGDRLLEIG